MYMAGHENAMGRRNEAAVFIGEAQRRDERTFANYYNYTHNEELIFGTTRVWSAQLSALSELFSKTRVVCCVRDALWIIDSIERLVRGNVFELPGVFGFEPGNIVYSRINRVATPGPGWHVIGTGDYSGRSDILFLNSSGTVDIREMSGTSVLASNSLATLVRPGTCRRGSDDRPRAMCAACGGWGVRHIIG
jgi:hypothetical protein